MTQPPSRILIIQPLPGIGDIAWFHAHIQAIKRKNPHSQITLLTKASSHGKEVLSAASYVSSVEYLDPEEGVGHKFRQLLGPLPLAQHLKKSLYDQAWIFHKSGRYIWGCRLAKIPHIYTYEGYYKHGVKQGDSSLSPAEIDSHAIDRATALLARHNIPVDQTIPCDVHSSLASMMVGRYHTSPRPWIVLGIGASEPHKKWAVEDFAALGARLHASYGGTEFILGGPRETQEGDAIVSALHAQHVPCHVMTNCSISESMAFLSQVDLYVGNDTGMMNIAAILNKPTVGLFIATPALRYRANLKPLTPKDGKKIEVSQVYEFISQSNMLSPSSPKV